MQKEIEVKFLLSDTDRQTLKDFLEAKGLEPHFHETQDNYYYNSPKGLDLRIRRTDTNAYLILKKGWMHDEDREEFEVQTELEAFDTLDSMLTSLGYDYNTKWHRERTEYHYHDFAITLDFNAGYGWVAEIEKVVFEGEEDSAKQDILALAQEIGLQPTPPEVFDKMYHYYKKNWQYYFDSGKTFTLEEIGE